MKKLILVSFLIFFIGNINAQDRGFGLGIMVGQPTGISGKNWISSSNAFDFGFGWAFVPKNSRINVHVTYLWHNFNVINSTERFPLYFGIGGRLKSHEVADTKIGVRFAIGLAWLPRSAPFDIFLEAAPTLNLTPSTSFEVDAALGARYFF